ncbi:hypothetical protein F511_24011 [Dorcoceras hygrometricum]|uniref:Uncharacterized protein n=1 Tax=Dorcoceras hygrometricum TaxID=472368 RepID=A0A2Z7B6C1_9LAMI|nr:hypothetical protein F511_24011 [Dorcoceras hygrometricum]
MQYLNRAMHEKDYQESSVDKEQRLSYADLINHHHLEIFRCDDSADHHKAVWYSGTMTQPATTSKQRWTFQARRLSRLITTCKGIHISKESGSIFTVHPNPISVDCRRFSPPLGARLVALSSSSLGLSIDTSLETEVTGFEEHEVVTVFVAEICYWALGIKLFEFRFELILRYLNRFELIVAFVEFAVKLLGQ